MLPWFVQHKKPKQSSIRSGATEKQQTLKIAAGIGHSSPDEVTSMYESFSDKQELNFS